MQSKLLVAILDTDMLTWKEISNTLFVGSCSNIRCEMNQLATILQRAWTNSHDLWNEFARWFVSNLQDHEQRG